jgi:predicted CopG family antitoxin
MTADATPTTITVPTYVRRMLDRYRRGGRTYADVILEFIEEWPTQEFLAEMERRLREEPTIPIEAVLKKAGL